LNSINQIDIKHITNLADIELSKLLHALLKLEAEKFNLQGWDAFVPFNITTGDAGSDGRIKWNGTPSETKWIKNKFTVFQNKATTLSPKNCGKEILLPAKLKQPRKLKKQIEKVLKEDGCYVLFNNRLIVENGKDRREEKFREAIKLTNEPKYDTFQILIYDANSIKDWVNEHIGAVVLVQEFNGIQRMQGFITWNRWEILSKAKETTFQVDENISININSIREGIINENIIRITGHSGLGKTRLVLEAFREFGLQDSLVYLNLEGNSNISEIKNYIFSYQETQNGIIILDNCDASSHVALSEIVKSFGNIKIITIGLDDSNSIQDLKIKIDRENQRSLVREIVYEKLKTTHQPSDIEYICKVSEGYPGMAIKFCGVIIKDRVPDLSKIPIDEFIKRLIFGDNAQDEIEYNIIRGCSVFSAFGFLDDSFRNVINPKYKDLLKAQMDFIRERIIDGEVRETKFREVCTKFLSNDIIEKRGTHLVIKPTILAINLAADWLIHTDSDRIIEIIKDLKDLELEEKFVDRLKDLDQLDKAKDIVADLWGPERPFGIAEVLNTSWGSRLFRYIVDVNPIETTRALVHEFANKDKEFVLEIRDGRRNLVWALEKLCFRKETFLDAAKILYSFSVSENETWGNNSTNQFKQLFQVYLPGTEATLLNRVEVIQWGLSKNDNDYTNIAIHAMSKGLFTTSFSRMGEAEKQGSSRPLIDFHPNRDEVRNYRLELIKLLTNISCSNEVNANFAKEKVANAIRILTNDDDFEILFYSLNKIIRSKGAFWPEALINLKRITEVEKKLESRIRIKIDSLIEQLTPTDLKNQILIYVTKPQWNSSKKDAFGNYIDQQKLNVEIFVEELIRDKLSWTEYLQDFLKGEQRQAFNFGVHYSENAEDVNEIIDKTIISLASVEKETQNPELLAGLLLGTKNKEVFRINIDKIIGNSDLMHHAFYLTRVSSPNIKDVEKLFTLIDEHDFSILHFKTFQYGKALDLLKVSEVLAICERISSYEVKGKWTAFSLLYMFCLGSEENWKYSKEFLKNLISRTSFLINDEIDQMDWFHWSDTSTRILNEEIEEEFSTIITKQVIELCTPNNFDLSVEIDIKNIITLLFEKYFVTAWPLFASVIIGDFMTFNRLESLIGSKNGFFGSGDGVLFSSIEYYKYILELCEVSPNIAPKRIAHMMPLEDKDANFVTWHPLSRKLIDIYGFNEDFLDELSSNMGSFGSIGSSVPYYIVQKSLLEELIAHPIEKVRVWAKNMLEYTNKSIKIERLKDDEQGIK